jgi:hypothetical protein
VRSGPGAAKTMMMMMSFICSCRNKSKIGAELHIYFQEGTYYKSLEGLILLFPIISVRVPGIDAEPSPSLQWWLTLSAVERMLARRSSEGIELEDTEKLPVVQVSHLSVRDR